jgi:hypothetical protein
VDVERAGAPARRTTDAQPGERLVLKASTGGAARFELRVYLNDRSLVLRCSTQPPCQAGSGALQARLALVARGAYQPVLVTSPRAIPEPRGSLDEDSGAALDQGAQVVLGAEVVVK